MGKRLPKREQEERFRSRSDENAQKNRGMKYGFTPATIAMESAGRTGRSVRTRVAKSAFRKCLSQVAETIGFM